MGMIMNNKIIQPVNPPEGSFTARKKTLAVMVSAVLGTAPNAYSQDPVLEEVIVTASKRKSNLQELPQAITAFTTEDIQKQGFAVLDDYANKIPSLAFARREPAGTSVVFRGVAASGIQFGTKPSAGVYLDEQPITQAGLNPDPRLIDIERVEALSGPQGTLFGDASSRALCASSPTSLTPRSLPAGSKAAPRTWKTATTRTPISRA